MIARSIALSGMILLGGAYARHAAGPEQTAPRVALSSLPDRIGGWALGGQPPIDDAALKVLGVDDYTSRVYADQSGAAISLYIGYYASQRQGDTIHSPQNCLPGAGWEPLSSGRTVVQARGIDATVNEYVIQKGLDRQVVLYWYEGRGRIVANEYANKFWLMIDAARLHRSNGSLVRIIAPAASADGVPAAADSARRFASALLPRLPGYLP